VRRGAAAIGTCAALGLAAAATAQPPASFEHRIASTTGGEPTVAVDPRDPRTLVSAITDRTLGPGAPQVGIVVSHDRGTTWRRTGTLSITSDPFVVADSEGRFFAGAVGSRPGTSGPVAALNTVQVLASTDRGNTWSTPVEAMGPDADIDPADPDGPVRRGPSWTSVDRPWLAVDPVTGDLYLTAVDHSDNSGGTTDETPVPWQANFAVCRTSADGYPVFACGRRYVTRSRDHGKTWSRVQPMDTRAYPADFTGGFSGIPTAAHGVLATAYVAGRRSTPGCSPCVVFETSTDGGAHWLQRVAHEVTVFESGVENPTASNPNDQVQPYVAADPSRKDHYALMVLDKEETKLLVYRTTDSGRHWRGPVVVAVSGATLLERPWLAYGPNGALGLMVRADRPDGSYDVWGKVAPDGDLRFGPTTRISTVLSPAPNTHSAVDDISSAVLDDHFLHAAWGDDRTGSIQPWYGRLRYQN
jgi:hypothetical protein